MLRTMVVLTLVMLLSPTRGFTTQTRCHEDSRGRRGVVEQNVKPQLGSEYANVAIMKVASRKNTYRVGEMISLDLAILNTGQAPVFVHKLIGPSIAVKVQVENGRDIGVRPYSVELEGIVPDSYRLLPQNNLLLGSFQLLAGCHAEGLSDFLESRHKHDQERQSSADYQKRFFSAGLFVNWGEGCLAFQQPGSFTIRIEQSNGHIIDSTCDPGVKTAVGTIRSNPLTISIVE